MGLDLESKLFYIASKEVAQEDFAATFRVSVGGGS